MAGVPISVIAAEWDAYTSDDVSNAFATDTDEQVTINLKDNIAMDTGLTANEGQSYTWSNPSFNNLIIECWYKLFYKIIIYFING